MSTNCRCNPRTGTGSRTCRSRRQPSPTSDPATRTTRTVADTDDVVRLLRSEAWLRSSISERHDAVKSAPSVIFYRNLAGFISQAASFSPSGGEFARESNCCHSLRCLIWPRTLRQRPSERRAACSSRRMPLSKLLAKRAALAAAPATRCRAPSSLPLLRPSGARCRSNPAHFVHSPPLMLRSHTHTHARARRKPAERIFSPQEIFELKRTLHTVWAFRRRASRRGRVRNVRSSQDTHEHTLSRVCV